MNISIHMIGMGRSGTYAIANWITSQKWPKRAKFHDLASWKSFVKPVRKGTHFYRHERNRLKDIQSRWKRVEINKNKKLCFIVRDPYNHFASIIKLWESFPKKKKMKHKMWPLEMTKTDRIVNGWKEYAEQALRERFYLPESAIFINYNNWFSDSDYRQELCDTLGLGFTDKSIQEVRLFPNNNQKLVSSFDKQRFDGKAQNMQVLERWRRYKTSPLYLNMFDDEVISYATKLFMPPPFDRETK